ncbi:MAG: sensor histidine kinase, partial [Hyphomonadaceae bacterium]
RLSHLPEAAEAFDDAVARLSVMSRIHRKLYDPNAGQGDFKPLIEELSRDLLSATGAKNVALIVQAPPVDWPIERLLTLSLIVTEALTNAVKHAWPDGRAGIIHVDLKPQASSRMELCVRDDGKGLPDGHAAAASDSLGMRIIQALAAQLEGEFTMENASPSGAVVRVAFPA